MSNSLLNLEGLTNDQLIDEANAIVEELERRSEYFYDHDLWSFKISSTKGNGSIVWRPSSVSC